MDVSFSPSLTRTLAVVVVLYVAAMYAIGFFARGRIRDHADFVVAGRRLPLSLAWMTLMATWFGAGTLLTVADEVRHEGVRAAGLDPFGAGVCLLLAGMFVAGRMWRMKLLTVADLFRRRFGKTAELIASLIMVPGYFGWIAAQFVALAGMLELFFGIDMQYGIVIVAVVGTGYTWLGGMWSVTLTDALQIGLVLVGLVILGGTALAELGSGDTAAGAQRLWNETPADRLVAVPRETAVVFWNWMALFAAGALGNMTGQDLMQRIFAARSERVARGACYIAGVAYLGFGLIPVALGLAANLLAPSADSAILPAMAGMFLSPALAVVFVVALLSAVLSTIDSAIIAPASVLAQNVFGRFSTVSPLVLNRWAVLVVAASSTAIAYAGEDAYSLLEGAYEIGLVGLFVPMMFGLYTQPRRPIAANASMIVGTGLWLVHYAAGWDSFLEFAPAVGDWGLPTALSATACSLVAYLICEPPWTMRRLQESATRDSE